MTEMIELIGVFFASFIVVCFLFINQDRRRKNNDRNYRNRWTINNSDGFIVRDYITQLSKKNKNNYKKFSNISRKKGG